MKKIKWAIVSIILAFALFWIGSIAVCEYNTYKYGDIFRNIKVRDISGEHYLEEPKMKVLEYNTDKTVVYVVTKNEFNNSGNTYYFKRNNENKWEFDHWDTIWSKQGNADEFIWPYIR